MNCHSYFKFLERVLFSFSILHAYFPTCRLPYSSSTRNLFTYILTHSIQYSPSWEANRFAANQEIPCTLWNPKVHHCTQQCPPPVLILNQRNPVHTPSHFLIIHLNSILLSVSGSSRWSLSCTSTLICTHFKTTTWLYYLSP
jgi:hypothetical protein